MVSEEVSPYLFDSDFEIPGVVKDKEGLEYLPFDYVNNLVAMVIDKRSPHYGKLGRIVDQHHTDETDVLEFSNKRIGVFKWHSLRIYYWFENETSRIYDMSKSGRGPMDLYAEYEGFGIGTFNELHDEIFKLFGEHFEPTVH